MKLTLTMDGQPDHENLAMLFNYAVAAEMRSTLNYAGVAESDVWPLVEAVVFNLAVMFDQGTFTVNGKTFRARVAFADEDAELLPGAAAFGHLHEYAAVEEEEIEGDDHFSIKV